MLKSHLTGVYDVTKTIVLRGGSRLSFLPTTVNRKERNALTLNWKGTVLTDEIYQRGMYTVKFRSLIGPTPGRS